MPPREELSSSRYMFNTDTYFYKRLDHYGMDLSTLRRPIRRFGLSGKSEESGVVLLDLIVCHGCYVQARELGLRTEEIGVRYRSPAETNSSSRQRLKRAVPPMAERNGREDMEQQK